MSIIRCFNCEQQLDSDFIEFHEYCGREYCDPCYENHVKDITDEEEDGCGCPPMSECICGEDDLPYSPI